ncbi:MAG: hypothetical protein ACLFV5_01515 [Anaerolineales bacterium]
MKTRERAVIIFLGLALTLFLLVSQVRAPVSTATTLASDILHLPLVYQPVPTPTPTVTPTPMPTPTPTRIASKDFGYGIQAAMVADGDHERIFDHVNDMGLGWVKQQVEWFHYNPKQGVYENWDALDRIVDAAKANDVNVLFSVVKAPAWARADTDYGVAGPPADPNTYGTFLSDLATHYRGDVKAYEIWNEQNLWYEWGGEGEMDAGEYVDLLRVAYYAIKDADPEAIVVSGGLTPTGDVGDIAIADRRYLEQMYWAGLTHYCDAVGAHPSGYNNPPDATYSGDPTTPNFKGHPSFFFRNTMEDYRNIMNRYGDGHKRIWPTEFGWASVDGLGVEPVQGYGYAEDNTEAEQAQYIVQAYEMGRSWDWLVGPMFLWNLNYAPVDGVHDEKAAFGIVYENWEPRPAFYAIRDMPK